jgi:hypothetical protein
VSQASFLFNDMDKGACNLQWSMCMLVRVVECMFLALILNLCSPLMCSMIRATHAPIREEYKIILGTSPNSLTFYVGMIL